VEVGSELNEGERRIGRIREERDRRPRICR
jgi:hypothetical protein